MPEIIVDFIPDFSKIQSGVDQLQASGQISEAFAAEMKAAQKPVNDLSKTVVNASGKIVHSFEDIEKHVNSLVQEFIDGFMEGINETLKESGLTLDEFLKKIQEGTGIQKSMKSELREMNEALGRMKVAGQDGTQAYKDLAAKAAEYRDAIGDVNEEVNKMASDTSKIDTVIEAVGALAAAGQIAAGAQALFGDESKELQETLVRLNAVMAIANGIQQIQNVLQKQSNLMRAIGTAQQKLANAQTVIETGLQSKNVIVKGAATVAQRALNAAMAANPAGILGAAIVALVGALAWFTSGTDDAEEKLADLNWQMEQFKRNTDNMIADLEFAGDAVIARMEAAGASGSKIAQQTLTNLSNVNAGIMTALDGVSEKQAQILRDTEAGSDEQKQMLDDLAQYENNLWSKIQANNRSLVLGDIKLQALRRDEAKKAAEEQERLAKEAAAKAKERQLARLNDEKAAIERQLLTVEQGSEAELKLRQRLIGAEANIELANEKLTANQRLLIQERALKERTDMEVEFYKNRRSVALQNQIADINAELHSIEINAGLREDLSIMLLNKQREAELAEVKNNKAKEAEINARYDRQIAETRLQIRRDHLDKELEIAANNNAGNVRQLQRVIADESASAAVRIDAVNKVADAELQAINRRKTDLKAWRVDQLISEQDYQLELSRLKDQENQVFENAEIKKTEIVKAENQKRREAFQQLVEDLAGYFSQAMNAVTAIFQAINAQEQQALEQRQAELEQAREAGAISERVYVERQRKLEAERKQQQRENARREKAANLFSALVNGAAAIVKAAPNPFMIAFTSALVAAQIAAIIATPLPRFGKGTKKAPRGFAEVGETGAELIQTDRGYYMAEHPQIVWLKGGERIYNPHETRQIMNTPVADRKLVGNDFDRQARAQGSANPKAMAKMIGDEIAKHPRLQVNLDQNGFTTHVVSQLARQTYLNKRYNYGE